MNILFSIVRGVSARVARVASAILADVEAGFQPVGENAAVTVRVGNPGRYPQSGAFSGRQDAALYGRQGCLPLRARAGASVAKIGHRQSAIGNPSAFSLIEVMLVVTLLSLIVIALMGVFSGTQRAFRASITQTDVLEGGRAAMDLMTGDLRAMQASDGVSNPFVGPYNLYVVVPPGYAPLVQTLTASSATRTNVLEQIFILTRQNLTWTGIGYVVNTNSSLAINPLYRFSLSTNINVNPGVLCTEFFNQANNLVNTGVATNMSRLLDGVVQLTVRAYGTNGDWMNYAYTNAANFQSLGQSYGETSFVMYSNTLPASVGIELGVLEDRTLQRAESRPAGQLRNTYLSQQAAQVHLFRQRVTIPNVDPSAYQ